MTAERAPYVVHDQDGDCFSRSPDESFATRFDAEEAARGIVRHNLSLGRRDGEVWVSRGGATVASWPLATAKPPKRRLAPATAAQRREAREARQDAAAVAALARAFTPR